jgi:hypothetical protein
VEHLNLGTFKLILDEVKDHIDTKFEHLEEANATATKGLHDRIGHTERVVTSLEQRVGNVEAALGAQPVQSVALPPPPGAARTRAMGGWIASGLLVAYEAGKALIAYFKS